MPDIWPALIEQLRETASVEYKSAAPWTTIKQKLMRAAIAMANNTDGGYIVVGVRPVSGGYMLTGLNPRERSSYANVESIQTQMSGCAAPGLEVAIELKEDDQHRWFAVFSVVGLRSFPHIATMTIDAKKQGITKGVAYVRTEKPSSEPCDQFLWDNLMRRAESLIAASFIDRMRIVGCGMQFAQVRPESVADDESLFRQERGAS